MQWWCSAQGLPWTWEWRPYPGVWLFVLLLASGYLLVRRRAAARRGQQPSWRRVVGWVGLAFVWLALDWPLGALGAGYLSSVHSTQFLLLTFIAPPLLLLGLGPATQRPEPAKGSRVARVLGALLLFNVVVIASHMPRVVDALMPTQLGAFAIDAAWLGSALLFWHPVLLQAPPIHPLARMGYIFWGTLAHTGIGVWLLLARLPVYRLYELAPPIAGIDPMSDQQFAGGIMELVGMIIIFGAVSLVALGWMQRENELEREGREKLARERALPGA